MFRWLRNWESQDTWEESWTTEDWRKLFKKQVDIQMANKYMKDAQHHTVLEKCKSKQWGSISHRSEWLPSERLHTENAGEGVEKREASYTVGGPSSQSYGFSSSHIWKLELEYKESWVVKNLCFWTVVVEKILESPLDFKEIKPVNTKGNKSVLNIHWKDWCWS